jgi:large subunit ribosomal protein L2
MKKLLYGFHSAVGRNNGLISSYHRGGGHRKQLRVVDRFRFLYDVPAKVLSIQYDPKRSARLALLLYTNGYVSFVPAISEVVVGKYIVSRLTSSSLENTEKGLSCPIRFVKVGLRISNIELYPGFGAVVARSGGLFAVLVRKYNDLALLKLASGEFRFFSLSCFCTIGATLLPHTSRNASKAGFNRWHGWRPVVRGRAMNPVDHPHGGRTNGGMTPTTPWARWVKGQSTSRSSSSLRLKSPRV